MPNQFTKAKQEGRTLILSNETKEKQRQASLGRKHSEKVKQIISEKRKAYFKANPDKHPWKRHDKFVSKPCEQLKRYLISNQISFISEYEPLESNSYSIDIAFPEKKLGIEVNGNQHYTKEGNLAPYYQRRHNTFVNEGWKIYEVHYSCCFDDTEIIPIINEILQSPFQIYFNYLTYKPREKKRWFCSCGTEKSRGAKHCPKCANRLSCKVVRPSKDELKELVWRQPIIKVAKQFGVSDVAVKKWCKKYDIDVPGRGYWAKQYALIDTL